jgi:hypothetical protein
MAMRGVRGERRRERHERMGQPVQRICLGDFNRHHPLWDDVKNTHLFTRQNLDEAQILLNFLAGHGLFMTLPQGLPTLEATTTKNLTQPDDVFCSEDLLDSLITCEVRMEDRPVATDHFPILTVLDTSVRHVKERVRYNFREVL